MKTEETKLEITRLGKQQIELTYRRRKLEADAASVLLDAGVGANAVGNERRERALLELRATELAIREASNRRTAALGALGASRAAEMQERADRLTKESHEITAQVDELKGKLAEVLGAPIEVVCAMPGRLTRLQHLGLQIQGFGEQIARLQRADVPDSGTVDAEGTSVDSLLTAVTEVEAIIPSAASILDWAEGCERAAGGALRDLPRRYHLVWRSGQIVSGESHMFCQHLCSRMHATSGRPGGFDISTGTFRAAVART